MELDPFCQHRALEQQGTLHCCNVFLLSLMNFFGGGCWTCVTPPMHRPPAVLVEFAVSVQRAGEDGLHLLPAFILQGAQDRAAGC